MADISIIHNGNTDYNVKDAAGRLALAEVENKGAKNLLKVSVTDAKSNAGNAGFTWAGNIASKNHVNFKINSDLTVDVSSDTGYTASDLTIFYLTDGFGAYPNTILNGCPSGGSNTTYELRTATPVKSDYGSGVEITSDSTTNVVIIIRSGWSGELTFKPMIRSAAISDPTFQSYALPNPVITPALIEQVDNGAKNVLEFDAIGSITHGSTYETNGVKFTLNADNTVTFERVSASSSVANCLLILNGSRLDVSSYCDGNHVLSGCPSGGGSSSYEIMATVSGGAYTKHDYGAGVILDYKSGVSPYIQLTVRSGFTGTATFKPMICTKYAFDVSRSYQPYARSDSALTAEMDYVVNTGVKNLLNLSGITPTIPSGLTLTDNNDGTFSVSGTLASANSIMFPIVAISGNLILSGCPSGGGESSYMLRLTKSGTAVTASTDTGSGSQIFSMDGTGYALAARFAAGTYTNVIFKPMIRSASISDTTYQPYAPTNRELYEDLQTKVTLVKVFGRGVGISNNDDLNTYQTLGRYCASNGTIAASLSNCPVTTGFVLTVTESFQPGGGIVQTIETLVSGGTQVDIYKRMRIYRNNTWSWGDWYKFEGTEVT